MSKDNRTSTRGAGDPPPPPLSESQEVQYGLRGLQRHNAATQYQPTPYAYGHGMNTFTPNFSSSQQRRVSIGQRGASHYQNAFDGSQLGYEYDQYGNPVYYENATGVHKGYHQSQYPAPISYFASSPPTPVLSDQDGGITQASRSNISNAPKVPSQPIRSDTPEKSRGARTTRAVKATKQAKENEKPKVPKLTAPLSELTKSYDHIPIRDMNAWVNRSDEARMRDVRRKNGYITRPMNSFMMYRSAYAERTKLWCLQNNHQVVSAVSGESWPMEPPEIRDLYIEYARRERENHAKAHPSYKFQPSKGDGSNRKRKGMSREVDEEELSELDDLDDDWRATPSKKGKTKAKKDKLLSDGHTLSPLERSTYEYNNPGKPLPVPVGSGEVLGQYWQKKVSLVTDPHYHPSSRVEDVTMRKVEAPSQYGQVPSLTGLPGQQHYDLLDVQSWDTDFLVNSSYGYFQRDAAALGTAIDPQLGSLMPPHDSDYVESRALELNERDFSFDITSATDANLQMEVTNKPASLTTTPSNISSSSGMTISQYSTAPAAENLSCFQNQDKPQGELGFDPKAISLDPQSKKSPWEVDANQADGELIQAFNLTDDSNFDQTSVFNKEG